MKTIRLLFLFLLGTLSVHAQEYVTRDIQLGSGDSFLVNTPIDVSVDASNVRVSYNLGTNIEDYFITHLSFWGYNHGMELTRHINLYASHNRGDYLEVFNGDCILYSGGSSEEPIKLMEIELQTPISSHSVNDVLNLLFKSTGDVSDEPVYFQGSNNCPFIIATIKTEVGYHEGTIINQDGNPVSGARICFFRPNFETGVNDVEYYGTSDAEGHYSVRVERGFNSESFTFRMSLECDGYPSYIENYPFCLGDKYESMTVAPKDITLWNKLVFTKDKKATIILPEAPDPSWGRYYRLDHFSKEKRLVVFEREDNPQANVPYVIFPNNDFSIDLSKYNLDNLPEPGFVPLFPDDPDESEFRPGFKGTYKNSDFLYHKFSVLDDTPDCCHGIIVDGIGRLPRVGAFRAYLDGSKHYIEAYGDITPMSPVDMTSKIMNPRFDNNDVETGWSGTKYSNWNAKENAEIYGDKYNSFQKIDDLPKGIYAVGAKAFYLEGFDLQKAFDHYKANDEAAHYAKLYAEANGRQTETDICSVFDNQVTEPLECDGEKSVYDEETGRTYYIPYYNLAAAERYMHELNCYDNRVLAMVDNSLTIGVKKEKDIGPDWSVFDDFTLFYYGNGADAYQTYLDEVLTRRVNTTVIKEGTLFTQYYLNELCKHRDASTEEEVNDALIDIQNAYDNLQTNIELWKKWTLQMMRGRTLASSPCYEESELAKQLAQHCGAEATEIEAARSLTNEQLEEEISKSEEMINALYVQEGFSDKLLKEGKQWVYGHHRDTVLIDDNGMPYDWMEVITKITYTINGDTLIDGRHYAKVYRQEGNESPVYSWALREEGTTLYYYSNGQDYRLIEFNPYRFGENAYVDEFYLFHPEIIDHVDNICVDNRLFTRHNYKDLNGSFIVAAVEGIGYEYSGIVGMNFSFSPSNYVRFEACYEDGKCIFTKDDFRKPTTTLTYRPMIEEGKVWKVGAVGSENPVQLVKYYYFDGDTIIDGRTCKQMMCQQYVSPDYPDYDVISQYPSLSYAGAWYEEDKKVYAYDSINNQFKLRYDFSLNEYDTLQIGNNQYVVGPRQTGGINGFKGVYRDVKRCENGESSYSPTWLEGVGSIDGPTINAYPGQVDPAWFLMSCAVGDEVIYLNEDYEDGATPEVMNARKSRFDFVHVIKPKPQAPMKREAEVEL